MGENIGMREPGRVLIREIVAYGGCIMWDAGFRACYVKGRGSRV